MKMKTIKNNITHVVKRIDEEFQKRLPEQTKQVKAGINRALLTGLIAFELLTTTYEIVGYKVRDHEIIPPRGEERYSLRTRSYEAMYKRRSIFGG